jgi:disease resistance protein RPM1
VKRIGSGSPVTPDKQFQNEVGNLMAVRHDNIVKLVGYCYEMKKTVVEHNGRYILADTVESLLCYEYMKMRSLDNHIFGMILTARSSDQRSRNIAYFVVIMLYMLHNL